MQTSYKAPNKHCQHCRRKMKRLIRDNLPRVDIFSPITLDNVAEEPMTFESRHQLNTFLDSKGFTRDR